MAEFDHLQEEMASLDFIGKLNFILKLLEAKEVSESEAYQLLVAEGKSRLKPCIENLEECITIEYFE